MKSVEDTSLRNAWALGGLGEQGAAVLSAALRDPDEGVRDAAANILAFMMGERGEEILKAALNDSNEETPKAAELGLFFSWMRPSPAPSDYEGDEPRNWVTGTTYLDLLVSSVAPLLRTLKYTGEAVLPKKIYVGDAENISLVMRSMGKIAGLLPETVRVQDTKLGKQVDLHIQERDRSKQFLEVELQSAAFTVDGEKKQRCLLGQETLSYQWNCYFPNSGNQALNLILRVIQPSGSHEVGTISQSIKVAKLDHLTQRQIGMITWLTGAAGFLSTIIGILSSLHLFGLH